MHQNFTFPHRRRRRWGQENTKGLLPTEGRRGPPVFAGGRSLPSLPVANATSGWAVASHRGQRSPVSACSNSNRCFNATYSAINPVRSYSAGYVGNAVIQLCTHSSVITPRGLQSMLGSWTNKASKLSLPEPCERRSPETEAAVGFAEAQEVRVGERNLRVN